ncbi:hypothetical protein [Actinocorallia lasiicapitis]
MEFFAGTPSRWFVTLLSGSTMELWADMFSEESDHYEFVHLVHASIEEQRHVVLVDLNPEGRENVAIVAARIPKSDVDYIEGGPVDPEDLQKL